MFYLNEEFTQNFAGADPFKMLQAMEGNIYRQVPGRQTFQFSLNGKSYFVKLHSGVGWGEISKNLLQLRLPILGAGNEWRAIHKLHELDVATLNAVAFGARGWNPASRESFIITEALENTVSLEDYCRNWNQDPPSPLIRNQLIRQLARISLTLHGNGICHRDYYLCHFLMHEGQTMPPRLSLIDLHRALIKPNLGRRWIIKDIAGLYYSAMDIGLKPRDILRFIRSYSAKGLRRSLSEDRDFWQQVELRARRMREKLGPA
jgi:heptose I phosphotransferase